MFKQAEGEFVPDGMSPLDFESAPFLSRLLAYGVDILLPTGLLWALPVMFPDSQLGILVWLSGFLLVAIYGLCRDGLAGGASLGKRLFGLVVVNRYSAKPCSLSESAIRNLVLLFVGPLELIFFLSVNRRRFGDWLAHTMVVKAN